MDIGILRGLITLALLVAFLGLVIRLYLPGRKAEFDAVARLPLEDTPCERRSDDIRGEYR